MIPVITEYAKEKALEIAKKKLGFDHVPSGIALKRDLGLIDYKYVWFQKVINHSTNVFIITYNSRFPTLYISRRDLQTTKTTRIFNAKKHGSEYELNDYRITPGILIEEYVSRLPSNSMLIVRDLTGERFIESYTYSNSKLKLLEKGINLLKNSTAGTTESYASGNMSEEVSSSAQEFSSFGDW